MRILSMFTMLWLSIFAIPTFADNTDNSNDTSTLTLTLINNSNQTLTYTGSHDQNQGNKYAISDPSIKPGARATITATACYDCYLQGSLNFSDDSKNNATVSVYVYRGYESREPSFTLQTNAALSLTPKSATLNTDHKHPKALSHTAATIEINTKN